MDTNPYRRLRAKLYPVGTRLATGSGAPRVSKEIFNFTGRTLYVTDQIGFSYELVSRFTTEGSEALRGKVIIKVTFSARTNCLNDAFKRNLNLPSQYKGKPDEDTNAALTRYLTHNHNQTNSYVGQFPYVDMFYSVDIKEFTQEESVVLEDLGIELSLLDTPTVHIDSATGKDIRFSNDVNPHQSVSFNQEVNLIDRNSLLDYVYINFLGNAVRVDKNTDAEHLLSDGLYVRCKQRNGKSVDQLPTRVFTLEELTEKNGFYRSAVDAENSASVDILKRRLDTELQIDRQALEKLKLSLEKEKLALEKEKQRVDRDKSTIERLKLALDKDKLKLDEAKLNLDSEKHKQAKYEYDNPKPKDRARVSNLERVSKTVGLLASIVLGVSRIMSWLSSLVKPVATQIAVTKAFGLI